MTQPHDSYTLLGDFTVKPYWIVIGPDFKIASSHVPNAWRRFWCWLLFGWRWERAA